MFSSITSKILSRVPKYNFSRHLKSTDAESYLKVTPKADPRQAESSPVLDQVEKFSKKEYTRGLSEDEKPIPTSPVLGPIRIENPKVSDKVYRWCSCGLSLKQPFCDGSHKGTQFFPVRFTVEEHKNAIDVCGCKFTKNAPYCDGETCVKLRNGAQ